MKWLKINDNIVSFLIEKDVFRQYSIDLECLSSPTPLVQDLTMQAVNLCHAGSSTALYITMDVSIYKQDSYIYVTIGLDTDRSELRQTAESIHRTIDVDMLDEIDFDFSQYAEPTDIWESIEPGTTVEVPIKKETQCEQSLYFEFNNLQDIEKYAKGNPSINKSDLLQKKNKYVLCITGVFDKTKEFFLEAKIAEFNGVRISPYYNDDVLIQQTALEILESI